MSRKYIAEPIVCEDCGRKIPKNEEWYHCFHCNKIVCRRCFHSPRHNGRVGG